MSEQDKDKEQSEERSEREEPAGDSEEKQAEAGEEAVPGEERPVSSEPERPAAGKEKKFTISSELEKALAEAEACVSGKDKSRAAELSAEGDSEIEIELDSPEPKPENKFDPNAVDEVEAASLPQASPRELELKMQILELRQQLRDKDQEIESRTRELKQNLDQARRLQRQLEDLKGRTQKEKADWFNYGHEPLLKELLTVLDNLERGLEHAQEDTDLKSLREGVELTLRQFKGTLSKFGVSALDPLGEAFNPEFHQAMMQVSDDSAANGTVVELHQKGYLLKDRLLRPAMVSVSKRSGQEPETETDSRPEREAEEAGESSAESGEDFSPKDGGS